MTLLTVLLTDLSDNPPDISNVMPSITESPFFIPGIVITVLLIAFVLRRLVFDNTPSEYTHNQED